MTLFKITDRRVDGRRRRLAALRAGLSASLISPSSAARAYRQHSAAMRCSAALRPPRALRRPRHGSSRRSSAAGPPRGWARQAAAAPVLDDPVPVRAVRAAAAVAHRRRHDRDVLGEGRQLRPGLRNGLQVCGDRPIRSSTSNAASAAACWHAPGSAAGFTGVTAVPLRRAGMGRARGWPGSTTANEYAARVSSPGGAASSTRSPARGPQRCRSAAGITMWGRAGTVTMPTGSRRATITRRSGYRSPDWPIPCSWGLRFARPRRKACCRFPSRRRRGRSHCRSQHRRR